MSGVVQWRKAGPRTFSPASGTTVKGGQVVETVTPAGRIQPAGAASVKAIGVALADAIAPENVVTTPTTGADGRPVTAMYSLPTIVGVADRGIEVRVTYTAAANFGDKLICAANGQVTPAGATPDARTIVGYCSEPLGVAAAGVGLMVTA
jgi:hypothetical protein